MNRALTLATALVVAACAAGTGGADLGPADVPGDVGSDAPGQDVASDQGAAPDAEPPTDAAPDAAADLPDTAADLPDTGPEPGSGPLVPWVGRVQIEERYVPNQGPFGSFVDVVFGDLPDPVVHDLVDDSGNCRYYRSRVETGCTPACPEGQRCTLDGHCLPWPRRLSAGRVTFAGLKASLAATPDDSAWYTTRPDPPADLFDPGNDIVVKAEGGEIPPFEIHVRGVADMVPGWTGEVRLEDGKPLWLDWPVKGDGARVEVALQIGWHGKPPTDIIWCEVDETAGGVEIPAAFIAMFPPWGGMGLFQNPSWARRVSRAVLDTEAGPVEVMASSQTGIAFLH